MISALISAADAFAVLAISQWVIHWRERLHFLPGKLKSWHAMLAISATLSASVALAEDFKTVSGKVYKDATVSRIEADGIELKTKTGISKVYFTELPQDVQERFHWAKPEAPPRAFLQPLGSGSRRSGCSGKNHRFRGFYHRQRRTCHRSYPFSTKANTASKTYIATESGSSCAFMSSR